MNVWRSVIYKGALIDSYNDKGFMRDLITRPIARELPQNLTGTIADFGSGNGFVGKTVAAQLSQAYRRRALPIGIDSFDKDFWAAKPAVMIPTVQGDLKNIPFKKNTFDAGILRFALPFVPPKSQPRALEQIYGVLKDGAVLVVLNDGVLNENKTAEAYNALFTSAAALAEGLPIRRVKAARYFPSCERLESLAEKAGFTVKASTDLTESALGYTSPEIYARTFNSTAAQKKELKAAFEKWKRQGALPFDPSRPDSLRVPWPMYACVLRK
jgi:ubiquinone/menaquinone biosynthesis C-methylase UbiE